MALSYRRDVDGMRAIAVLAVIAFHADLKLFHGGFIGVDVFFVISGYLISGIIVRALRTNNFSFLDFYARRINRIFPALIVVLLASCAVGWGILFSQEFASLGKQTLAGAGFSSNFLMWNEAGYFDSARKPLLHLWSLGVEEQFYIVWPLTLFLLWKMTRYREAMIVLILICSFSVSVFQAAGSSSVAAFYSPLTRVWELAAGTLVYLIESKAEESTSSRLRASMVAPSIAALTAVILFAMALWITDRRSTWPGTLTLLPVGATALLLATGERSPINRLLLGNKILVGIGLISYPLYLWHWPLLVFEKYLFRGAVPWTARFVAIAASFVLAYVTYRIVEIPVRTGARKRLSALILAGLLTSVAVIGLMIMQGDIHSRLYASSLPELAWTDWGYPEKGNSIGSGNVEMNSLPGDSDEKIVMIGDSHMEQYFPRFELLSRSKGIRVREAVFVTSPGCPPIPGLNRFGNALDGGRYDCDRYNKNAFRVAGAADVKAVVVAAFWEAYWNGKVYSVTDRGRAPVSEQTAAADSAFKRLEERLLDLKKAGKAVSIILSNPSASEFAPELFLPARLPGFPAGDAVASVSPAKFIMKTSSIRERLLALAARVGASVVDPLPYLCPNGSCPTQDAQGLPIYRDTNHLRASFVREKVMFLDRIVLLPPQQMR